MEKRNVSIQVLRVCACLMVFVVHFGQRIGLTGIAYNFTDFGKYGVHLFFLISGFLAAKTFFRSPETTVFEYYKKRLISILPLYYLVILYYFITENILNHFIEIIPPDELGVGWFRYLFLLNGFLNSNTYFWSNLGITWTIPVFMCFYLIAPWILKRFHTVPSSIVVWLVVFITTKLMGTFCYSCVIFTNIHFLFLGVVLFACINEHVHWHGIIGFSVAALCAIILGNVTFSIVAVFSCIILSFVAMENFVLPTRLQQMFNTLDKYSYTLYLVHGVVFCSLLDRLNLLGVSKIIIALLAIILTVIATWIVGKYIEKPIQSQLKKHLLKTP